MAHWRERYIETIQTAHKALDGQLALDLFMPVWWGDPADWGETLLDPLAMANLSITVMNYRTDPVQLYRGAVPFLEWGAIMASQSGRQALGEAVSPSMG